MGEKQPSPERNVRGVEIIRFHLKEESERNLKDFEKREEMADNYIPEDKGEF